MKTTGIITRWGTKSKFSLKVQFVKKQWLNVGLSRSVKAAKPVKEIVVLADANVQTKNRQRQTILEALSHLWACSYCVANTCNGQIPQHDKTDDSVCSTLHNTTSCNIRMSRCPPHMKACLSSCHSWKWKKLWEEPWRPSSLAFLSYWFYHWQPHNHWDPLRGQ